MINMKNSRTISQSGSVDDREMKHHYYLQVTFPLILVTLVRNTPLFSHF